MVPFIDLFVEVNRYCFIMVPRVHFSEGGCPPIAEASLLVLRVGFPEMGSLIAVPSCEIVPWPRQVVAFRDLPPPRPDPITEWHQIYQSIHLSVRHSASTPPLLPCTLEQCIGYWQFRCIWVCTSQQFLHPLRNMLIRSTV